MAQPSVSLHASVLHDRWSFSAEPHHEFPGLRQTPDSEHILAELRTMISDGNFGLDAMLHKIVEAAQMLTRANGAAIAIRWDNSFICQARVGDMAPDLGIKLDTDSGISGQCLRTGRALCCDDTDNDARVDAEVCRGLGLRSIAVVPVGKKPAVSGVLEAFSSLPRAFNDTDVESLEQLAQLVNASQRLSEDWAVPRMTGEFAVAGRHSWSKRGLILAAGAVLALLLGWQALSRKPHGSPPSAAAPPQQVAGPVATPVANASPLVVSPPDRSLTVHVPDTKSGPPPGIVMASKREDMDSMDDVVVRMLGPEPTLNPTRTNPSRPPQHPDSAAETAPVLAAVSTSPETALHGLLSASNHLPQAAIRISQGLSGGTIERRVKPLYPSQAIARRLEGRVLLQALVTEDGTLRDLKVVNGDPLLARAAMEAVARWHYRPYRLNGVPIHLQTEITLLFKLP